MSDTKPILLGVNVDHIATLRQARGTRYPDPVKAALIAEDAGADGITIHLREDRRHIQERDVLMMQDALVTRMNLEMAITEQMIAFAEQVKPQHTCLVPEKREELTTEGGLDVLSQQDAVADACQRLGEMGSEVSLFIDPDKAQIDAAKACGAPTIELHTGCYAEAKKPQEKQDELSRIIHAAEHADSLGLIVNAGHGLFYNDVKPVAAIPQVNELNIGHGIMSQAFFLGLFDAVKEMKQLMLQARAESAR